MKKKTIIYFILILTAILFLFFLLSNLIINIYAKQSFEKSILAFKEKNSSQIFSIDKIIYFSSCDSKNKYSSPSNFTIENLYCYTDIALYINNHNNNYTSENTLKTLKISNIKFSNIPKLGNPNLYYKSLKNFAQSTINENNLINNDLNFIISSENELDLSLPTLYNNCANPITLSYINQNIKTDYTILDTSTPITYNGSLLNRCNISLESVSCALSFDIYIENNKNEKFKTCVYLEIPYKHLDNSITDGSITVTQDTNFNFYRYE